MTNNRLVIVGVLSTLAGCGTIQAVSSMPNPARTTDKIQSTQGYEIGPFKENHQYEATIASWSPDKIGVRIRLADVDRCSDPSKYTFTFVDDRGARASLQVQGDPARTTHTGRQGMTVIENVVSGEFAAAVNADSKQIAIEQRPVEGIDCPKIDFRWNLQ
jgi:hypothetical protein